MNKNLYVFFLVLLLVLSYQLLVGTNKADQLRYRLEDLGGKKGLNFFILPDGKDLGNIPFDPKNPLTPAKVRLGEQLFYEPILGSLPELPDRLMYSYSCATCHAPSAGFQNGARQAIGDGGIGFGRKGEGRKKHPSYRERELDVQLRKTPSILNVAYQELMFWDGQFGSNSLNKRYIKEWLENTPSEVNFLGFEGVESQAIAAFGVHRLSMPDSLILSNKEIKSLFDEAFPETPESSRYSDTTAALAIAAYERTLLTSNAPFQKWLRGEEEVLSEAELEGALLFFGKAKCFNCHTGPALNSNDFYALGMGEMKGAGTYKTSGYSSERLGRAGFTKREEDLYKFKVPQLYNLKDAEYFGHGATFKTISEVIEYFNLAEPQSNEIHREQLSDLFVPLNLNQEEISQLHVFISESLWDIKKYEDVPRVLVSGSKPAFLNLALLDSLSTY